MMKNIYDVLRQKELEVERLKKEIEALRIVAPMLMDEKDQSAASATATTTKAYTSSQQNAEPVVVGETAKAARVWP
jgi:hypothetical protein